MKARRVGTAIVAAAWGMGFLTGCTAGVCVDRGTSAVHSGSVSWNATSGSGAVQSGADPGSVQVDDLGPGSTPAHGCSSATFEFTLRIASCLLWAQTTGGASATIEPQQSCELPVGSHVAVVTTDAGGSVMMGTYDAPASPGVHIIISGKITSWDNAPSGGYLQWTFQGS